MNDVLAVRFGPQSLHNSAIPILVDEDELVVVINIFRGFSVGINLDDPADTMGTNNLTHLNQISWSIR